MVRNKFEKKLHPWAPSTTTVDIAQVISVKLQLKLDVSVVDGLPRTSLKKNLNECAHHLVVYKTEGYAKRSRRTFQHKKKLKKS